MSLLAFTLCLLIGGLSADNTLATTVWRATLAMGATYAVALIVGLMAQTMLEEHVAARAAKSNGISRGETERQ